MVNHSTHGLRRGLHCGAASRVLNRTTTIAMSRHSAGPNVGYEGGPRSGRVLGNLCCCM